MIDKKLVREATEELYVLNANISLFHIGFGNAVSEKDILVINDTIGKIIRKLREANRDG